MIKLVSWIISKIKKREYKIDENITALDLISIVNNRLFMVIRGIKHKFLFKKGKGLIFVGKKVKIRSHSHIKCGSGMTIEDGCFINALCKNGVIIGNNFSIGRNSIIECTGVIRELGDELIIGNNVGIAANAFISVRGKVEIGDSCIFGPYVKIFSENHNFNDLDTPIFLQGATQKGVKVGKDCWIGANVTILDGVKIGKKVVVAAGSVINKDIPDYSIVGGVPAKVLKMRK
ncbi:MAG: hypothetical protein PWP67_1847 [Clostridium butyricum]|nr:hypothetical protein [Clostridium butyricum]